MQTLTTTKVVSVACPLGCKRTVAATGKTIHYCVIGDSREYVGTLDGQYVCAGGSNIEVETQLNDRVLDLIEQGLVDQPLALLDEQPAIEPDPNTPELNDTALRQLQERDGFQIDPDETPGTDPWPDTPRAEPGYTDVIRTSALWLLSRGIDACTICGDAHRPTQCPEVAAQRDTCPDAGRALARQWHRDRARFLNVLRSLDRDAWCVLAEAYAAYMSRFGAWIRPAHVLSVWTKAIDADIVLPPRAA